MFRIATTSGDLIKVFIVRGIVFLEEQNVPYSIEMDEHESTATHILGEIALGYDRLVMILAGADNLREVIAFPKTTSGASLMDGCPTEVDERQLNELGLSLAKDRSA